MEEEDSSNACLVCCKKSSEVPFICWGLTEEFSTDGSCLDPQLNILFVLRKLLLVPQDVYDKIISEHGNPADWGIFFCFQCSELIEDAQHISAKIKDYFEKFKSVQDNIQAQLRQSLDSSANKHPLLVESIRQEVKKLQGGSAQEEGIGDEKTKRVESSLGPENSVKDESLAKKAAADPLPAPEAEFPVGLDFIKLSPQSVHSNSNDFDPMDFEFDGDGSSIYPGSVVKVKVQSEEDSYDMTTNNNEASPEINANIKHENDDSTSDSEDGWEPPKPLSKKKKGTKSSKKLDCPMCKKKNFSSVKLFKLHFEKIHLGGTKPKRQRAARQATKKPKSEDGHDTSLLNARNQERKYTVKCPEAECNQYFPSEYFRDAHHKRKHQGVEKPFQCEKCFKAFERHQSLVIHKKSCKGDGNTFIYPADPRLQERSKLQCTQCQQYFTTEAFRDAHVKRRHEGIEKPYSCGLCEKEFSRNYALTQHLKTAHKIIAQSNINMKYDDLQEDNFDNPPDEGHAVGVGADEDWLGDADDKNSDEDDSDDDFAVKSKTKSKTKKPQPRKRSQGGENGKTRGRKRKPRDFKCSFEGCTEAFTSEFMRLGHFRSVHEGIQKPYNCDEPGCDKSFKKVFSMQVHKQVHHSTQTDGHYICETCGKIFYKKVVFQRHVQLHKYKTPDRIYPCDECGKLFRTIGRVERHKLLHRQVPPCEVCGKVFLLQLELFNHRRLEHQLYEISKKPETEACGRCQKSFSSAAKLKLHIENYHENIFKYVCNVCGMGYSDKSSHDRHVLKHTGVKPYNCDLCGKGFTRSADLVRHRRIHTGEKPYKCSHCSEMFADTSKLRKHIKVAHNQPNYECDICSKKFYMFTQLRLHKQTHESSHLEQLKRRKKSEEEFLLSKPIRGSKNRRNRKTVDLRPQDPKPIRKPGRPSKRPMSPISSDTDDEELVEVPDPYLQQYSNFSSNTATSSSSSRHQNSDMYRPNNPSLADFQPSTSGQSSHAHSQAMNLLQHGYLDPNISNRYLQQLHQHLNNSQN